MAFTDYLEKIFNGVGGALACGIVGFDGLAVETYPPGPGKVDLESINAELSTGFRDIIVSFNRAGLGPPEELMIKSRDSVILLHTLNDDYCLMLALESGAGIGKARYLLKVFGPLLESEL